MKERVFGGWCLVFAFFTSCGFCFPKFHNLVFNTHSVLYLEIAY